MRPSPSHSLRSILLLVVLGALAMAATAHLSRSTAAPRRAIPLGEAVERTLAAGTARLTAVLTTDGARVRLAGVTSLTTTDGDLTLEVGDDPGAGAVGLRTIDGHDWIRVDGQWIDADGLPGFDELPAGWGDYVSGLEADGPDDEQPRRATLGGAPARVWLDGDGRVARIVAGRDGDRFDLRLSGFGVALDLEVPEPS